MRPSPSTNDEQSASTGLTQPAWLMLYYALAIFTLLTVVMSLFFSRHLVQRYRKTVDVNHVWTERLERYAELGQMAALANMAIHSVFASYDVETEAARTQMFLRLSGSAMATLLPEVQTNVPHPYAALLLEDLSTISDTLDSMAGEAEQLFTALHNNQPLTAQKRLAKINRLYTDTTTAFEALREDVRIAQKALFKQQSVAAERLETYEYFIAGCLLLLVGGVLLYGRALARRMEREVREKERYHTSLRDAEARTRAIIDTAADGIITINARGIIESFNPAAERIFGYDADSVVGKDVRMLMPSPYREQYDAHLARYMTTGRMETVGISRQVEGQRKDGAVFPMDITVSSVLVGGETLFTGIVRDITERKRAEELRKVRDHFAKFVPEAVQRLVAANPDAPELDKQEHDVSVLFLDISGYARLSERLPPDVLNELVERYFSTFLDCIHDAGGDINETAGDGFMAIFQDPDPQRHAMIAVDTALALLEATEHLNADSHEQPLAVHMGINSGTALVGSTRLEGARGTRWIFTASGTVTNLAARLAGIAQPGQVLAGAETVARLGASYRVQRLSREYLKNFTEAVDIYRVLGSLTTEALGSE
jgi:PAS domain S-box-containing protein